MSARLRSGHGRLRAGETTRSTTLSPIALEPLVTRGGDTLAGMSRWTGNGWTTDRARASPAGGDLVYSDSPECPAATTAGKNGEIAPSGEGVLYRQRGATRTGIRTPDFRVYFNHENRTGTPRALCILFTSPTGAAVTVTPGPSGLAKIRESGSRGQAGAARLRAVTSRQRARLRSRDPGGGGRGYAGLVDVPAIPRGARPDGPVIPTPAGDGNLTGPDLGIGIGRVPGGRKFTFSFMPPGGASLPVAVVVGPAYPTLKAIRPTTPAASSRRRGQSR